MHGEKALNIKFITSKEELIDDMKESADIENKDSVFDVDTETGEIKQVRKFFLCNPAFIYHFGDDPNNLKITLSKKARDKINYLSAQTLPAAIDFMTQIILWGVKRKTLQT